jgi:PAS domain S-box-containing protein
VHHAKEPINPPQKKRKREKKKEWQYRNTFNAANDGLIVNDLETGIVVEANPEACLMHGYTRQEFIGRQLADFIHPDSQHAFSEYIWSFQSDGVFDTRILHVCKDGSTFYAEWRGTAFMYQGRSCLLSVVRDVNKRIQAEQLLHQHAETRTLEQETLLAITFAICGFHFRQVTELHVG